MRCARGHDRDCGMNKRVIKRIFPERQPKQVQHKLGARLRSLRRYGRP